MRASYVLSCVDKPKVPHSKTRSRQLMMGANDYLGKKYVSEQLQ